MQHDNALRWPGEFGLGEYFVPVVGELEPDDRRGQTGGGPMAHGGVQGLSNQFSGLGPSGFRLGGSDTARGSQVVGLQDRHGAVRPIMAFDSRTAYEGLCLEDVTNTHAAVFTHTYEGRSSPEVDTAYYHYDADAGNLVEAHVNEIVTQPTGEDAVCRWYATAAGLRAYNDALWELRPGGIPYADLGKDPEPLWEGPLPTRVIPAEVVETQLERLRGLPDLVRVWEADLHSPERKIVAAEYRGVPRSRSVMCEGVLLVWDEARQEWRSIYGCARFYEIEIHGDTLSAALTDEMALDCWRHWQTACYLEVDLTTWLAELWEDRFRGH